MADDVPAPTGLARRGRRLSDAETMRRMLDAAVAMVNRTGLTVSLDHISFEDVIREAGVARSAVYRHWPYKDLFFSDLVKELAKAAIPSATDNAAIVAAIRQTVAGHPYWARSAEHRHDMVMEVFRQTALLDFQMLYGSAEWRTYLALHATFLSLAEGQLRDEVQRTLAESQRGFVSRVAAAWERLATLFGYRLRPELDATFDTVATLVSASSRGLVIMALSTPDVAQQRLRAKPFGSSTEGEWSLAALGIGSVASAFLEPDPAIEWDDSRIAAVRDALDALALPGP